MTKGEALQAGASALHCDIGEVSVQHGPGHDGTGWYAWHTEYPGEGSMRVDVRRKAEVARGQR